ncbi:MAG: dihydrofolate reductase family protein, partial [Desertimonas sp.]
MRMLLAEFISLDGVVQAPGAEREDPAGGFRHGGWARPYVDDEVMGPAIDELMTTTDAVLFGRRTYQAVAATWAAGTDDAARRLLTMPKYVASRTLGASDVTWDQTVVLGGADARPAIRRLKSEGRGTLTLMGSAELARQLIADGLVDEYRLMIEPVLLGGGKRVFPHDGWKRSLRLVSVEPT